MTNAISTMQPSLQDVVDDLTWRHLNVNAPGLSVNPAFMAALGPEPRYHQWCSENPLTFAPGLSEVLASSSPPSSVEFFESLPNPQDSNKKLWIVYAVVLVKPGCPPKVYIGSGTNARDGGGTRIIVYKDKKSTGLPRFVKLAFDQGYELAHAGALCWAPIPTAGRVPRARARFIAIEALFTTIFFAAFETICDTARIPLDWDRDDVQYDPLGSHSPLMEKFAGIDQLDFTPEQLEFVAAARRQCTKMRMAVASKARDERERAQDLEGHLARKRTEKQAWYTNNQARAYDNERSSITNTIAAKKHYCSTCDISFGKPGLLHDHVLTDNHRKKAANVAKNGRYIKSDNASRSAKCVAAAKASKKNHCAICDLCFGTPAHLKKHKDSKRHLAKEALFASAATSSSPSLAT
ncbi:carbamoyl-phosphate synthase (glutamine-hydrolyzing) cpa2 [Exophiala xenobiotica]|uniref:Carbamoyl-phosphate synthase (Glutamine-hydrolyzing) cpa2 n=1 Tax=Lithohypha guttulata TaxID=1690604 RepID=A0ABR0JXB7_9EURO|nr:carbamoyl-phosphate synthase (glutamine-hydrolyzing) cpa2 [Lithohypha guttulata]KAK5310227.1 carbamoyl-phosphate synthase (glutamine-hydrolyzing) cpa2 [Exophiala xenobiotica]